MLSDTAKIEQFYRDNGEVVDIVSHTYWVAQFLNGLAEQLDRDGFTEKQYVRFVVRSIQDVARELLEQASGSSFAS